MPYLINRTNGELEPVEVVTPIGQTDIECFNQHWSPLFQARLVELRSAGLTADALRANNVEDGHWEWPQLLHARSGLLEWGTYALRCGALTQGMMFVSFVPRCRLSEHLGEHMVYVDRLATAPWNRRGLAERPLYRGVGIALLLEAIERSFDEGFAGRIGLHALPGASDFYRELGMQSLGSDDKYAGLEYFEMNHTRAATLCASRT